MLPESAGAQTVQSKICSLKESGPTAQDRRVFYANCFKRLTQIACIMADSLSPDEADAIITSTHQTVKMAAEKYKVVRNMGHCPNAKESEQYEV